MALGRLRIIESSIDKFSLTFITACLYLLKALLHAFKVFLETDHLLAHTLEVEMPKLDQNRVHDLPKTLTHGLGLYMISFEVSRNTLCHGYLLGGLLTVSIEFLPK